MAKTVQEKLSLLEQLLTELTALAPKECADPDTADAEVMTWQSTLLAVDNARWALDDLASDLAYLAENEPSQRPEASDEDKNTTATMEAPNDAR